MGKKNLGVEQSVQIAGRTFTLRTSEKERLDRAVSWLSARLQTASLEHSLLKASDLYLSLLLELAFERTEWIESGKALLKETDQLLECIDNQLN